MTKQGGDQWPGWPEGPESVVELLRVEVNLPADQLFRLVWEAGSPFMVRDWSVGEAASVAPTLKCACTRASPHSRQHPSRAALGAVGKGRASRVTHCRQ